MQLQEVFKNSTINSWERILSSEENIKKEIEDTNLNRIIDEKNMKKIESKMIWFIVTCFGLSLLLFKLLFEFVETDSWFSLVGILLFISLFIPGLLKVETLRSLEKKIENNYKEKEVYLKFFNPIENNKEMMQEVEWCNKVSVKAKQHINMVLKSKRGLVLGDVFLIKSYIDDEKKVFSGERKNLKKDEYEKIFESSGVISRF